MTEDGKGTRRARWQPFVLIALFLGPLVAAWTLYFGSSDWRPGGGTNHGVLIDPPVTLPDTRLVLADGAETDPEPLMHRWTMLYVDAGECADQCREALYRSRQVWLSLGRKLERVQRLYVFQGDPPDPEWIASEQEGLIVATADSPGARQILAAFPQSGPPYAGNIYLVDPLGNLMMRFPLEDDPKGMLEDLKRLLRLSRIG